MSHGISLIVGLGNPGQQYQRTRHNAGAWFLELVCQHLNTQLRPDSKVFGLSGRVDFQGNDLRLLVPTTYMNHSGKAVSAMCQYFKIAPQEILVAYDDLDLPAGTVRLKQGGGHGGHNGIRDIISALGTSDFQRLRLGIGHPGDSSQVLNFVLGEPGKTEKDAMDDSLIRSLKVLPLICEGKLQIAMNSLHTQMKTGKTGKDSPDGN
jgi:PTH1 family peptidyl-tRNA hydrolase